MSTLWIATIGASLACLVIKQLGYSVPESWLNRPRIQRVNELIPVVLLSALIGVQTFATKEQIEVDHRVIGLAVAAVALKMRLSFPIMMIAAAMSSALVYNFIL